jgi:hypothetical protein
MPRSQKASRTPWLTFAPGLLAPKKVSVELRTIRGDASADSIEHIYCQAAGIGARLEHQGRYRTHQHDLGNTFGAMASDVTGDFSAARGMADQDSAVQVEGFDEIRKIIGIGVHLVAVRRLARAPMATAIVGDTAIAVGRQEDHLIFPGIGVERPAVTEHDRLPCSPILVVDPRAVLGGDRAHVWCSILLSLALPACGMHLSGRSTCRNDFDDLLDSCHSQRLGGAVA